jgi:hypothetical protein
VKKLKKVFGLVATLIVLALAVGTFAPSQVTLNPRNALVPLISSDQNSMISVRNHGSPPGPNWGFVKYYANGSFYLEIKMSNGIPLNPDSVNYFDMAIDISNQGVEGYKITISSDNPRIKFYTTTGNWWYATGRGGASQTLQLKAGNPPSPAYLAAGNTWAIGVMVDATGLPTGSTIQADITVTAENS